MLLPFSKHANEKTAEAESLKIVGKLPHANAFEEAVKERSAFCPHSACTAIGSAISAFVSFEPQIYASPCQIACCYLQEATELAEIVQSSLHAASIRKHAIVSPASSRIKPECKICEACVAKLSVSSTTF